MRLVSGVVYRGGRLLTPVGGEFNGDGGAGHAFDGRQSGAADGDRESRVLEGRVEDACQGDAAADRTGLRGFPGRETGWLRGRKGGHEEMNSRAGLGGVQGNAGLRI